MWRKTTFGKLYLSHAWTLPAGLRLCGWTFAAAWEMKYWAYMHIHIVLFSRNHVYITVLNVLRSCNQNHQLFCIFWIYLQNWGLKHRRPRHNVRAATESRQNTNCKLLALKIHKVPPPVIKTARSGRKAVVNKWFSLAAAICNDRGPALPSNVRWNLLIWYFGWLAPTLPPSPPPP